MRRLYALIDRVKDTDVPILVTGESGTGKEMVARAVHQAGPRAKKPFLGVNCGAIPANLLESELFGNVKGAFTGADRDRKGLFREADGGTLLLDEIGEMPQKMQVGLLRVLQERRVRPVGGDGRRARRRARHRGDEPRSRAMVAEGTFREDLYYRLHVVELACPRCASASRTSPRSSITSCPCSPHATAATERRSRATPSASSAPSRGPATCGSSSTFS